MSRGRQFPPPPGSTDEAIASTAIVINPPQDQHMRWSPQQRSPQQRSPQQWSSQQRSPQQWSSQQQSSIDPPPRISTWGDCLNSDHLNSNRLNSDCLNSDHRLTLPGISTWGNRLNSNRLSTAIVSTVIASTAIVSTAIIDWPPPISTWGDHLNSNRLNSDCLNSDHLNSDCLNSNCQLTPPGISTWGDRLNSDCLNSDCLNSDCLNSDCLNSKLSQQRSSIYPPPQISTMRQSPQQWSPQQQSPQQWSPQQQSSQQRLPQQYLSIDPPPTDFNFRIFNILIDVCSATKLLQLQLIYSGRHSWVRPLTFHPKIAHVFHNLQNSQFGFIYLDCWSVRKESRSNDQGTIPLCIQDSFSAVRKDIRDLTLWIVELCCFYLKWCNTCVLLYYLTVMLGMLMQPTPMPDITV